MPYSFILFQNTDGSKEIIEYIYTHPLFSLLTGQHRTLSPTYPTKKLFFTFCLQALIDWVNVQITFFFKAIISSVKNLLSNISLLLAKQCDRSCGEYKIKCKRTFASFKELKIEIRSYDSYSSTQATIESCKVNVLPSLWMELGPYLPK